MNRTSASGRIREPLAVTKRSERSVVAVEHLVGQLDDPLEHDGYDGQPGRAVPLDQLQRGLGVEAPAHHDGAGHGRGDRRAGRSPRRGTSARRPRSSPRPATGSGRASPRGRRRRRPRSAARPWGCRSCRRSAGWCGRGARAGRVRRRGGPSIELVDGGRVRAVRPSRPRPRPARRAARAPGRAAARTPRRTPAPGRPRARSTSASWGPEKPVLSSSASAPIRAVALSASTKPRWLRHRMPTVSAGCLAQRQRDRRPRRRTAASSSAQVSEPRSSTSAVPVRSADRGEAEPVIAVTPWRRITRPCGGTCRGAAARSCRCAPGSRTSHHSRVTRCAGSELIRGTGNRRGGRARRGCPASARGPRGPPRRCRGRAPNSSRDVDRLQHPGVDLGRQREVRPGTPRVSPNGKPKVTGRYFVRSRFSSPKSLAMQLAAARGGSGPPGRRCSRSARSAPRPPGPCGRSRCGRRSRSCCAPSVGRNASWSPPGKTIVTPPERSAAAALSRVAGRKPALLHRVVRAAHEQQVVREAVERAVVAELLGERDRDAPARPWR